MKNILLYLALLINLPITVICMDNGVLVHTLEDFTDLEEQKRPKTPPTIIMERVRYQHEPYTAESKHRHSTTDVNKLFDEYTITEPIALPVMPKTNPFKAEKPAIEQSGDFTVVTPAGDDSGSDEEHNEPKLDDTSLVLIYGSNTMHHKQADQTHGEVKKEKSQELAHRKFTVHEIVTILTSDETKKQKKIGDRSLTDIILPEQKEGFELYYERLATIEELTKLYLVFKEITSKIPFEQRKKSIEYQHRRLVYQSLLKKFKNDKKKVKTLLCGLADYETEEEETLQKEDFKDDGSDVYRLSKNIFTYTLPTVKKLIGSVQINIENLTNEQNTLIEEIKKLKEAKKAANLRLKQEISHKHDLKNAETTLEAERKNHYEYLVQRKATLEASIIRANKSLMDISNDNEEAIILQDLEKQKKLKAQKNAIEVDLNRTQSALAQLEHNMTNFDSPSGYRIWK